MLMNYLAALKGADIDGTALANSTTATSLLPASSKPVLPPDFFQFVRQQILVVATGRISNIVTTPGTLTLDLRLGASTVIANGGALNLNIVAKTNVSWYLFWLLTVRAVGAGTSANFMHQGLWVSESFVGAAANTAGTNGIVNLPVSAPAVGSGFDATAQQTLDLFATWSIANAGNSIQLHQFAAISLT